MEPLLYGIAPVAIILFYIYFRDKYEKEPLLMLLKALGLGAIIVIPVMGMEYFLKGYESYFIHSSRLHALYTSTVVAGFSEELFKFLAFFWLIRKSKEYNERFDGIVYATFVSLGFAMVENINYLYTYGIEIHWNRAIFSVPAHAFFGISMGYYFSMAKFSTGKRSKTIFYIYSFLFPLLLHGAYDFILMADEPRAMFAFIPFMIYLYYNGFRRLDRMIDASKPTSNSDF
jgi:RsiW-degrading membrane proteinase PrsW (M82 family)